MSRYGARRGEARQVARRGERDDNGDALVALYADVAGALQFGVTPTLEVGQSLAGFLRLRPLNTGLASYFLIGRDRDDDLHLGFGGALGLHYFGSTRGNMRGWYGGVALEYIYVETRDVVRDFAQYRTHALVPELDFGYRWALGDMLLGLSLKLGLAVPFENSVRPLGDNGCPYEDSCRKDFGVALFPGVSVDIGGFIAN